MHQSGIVPDLSPAQIYDELYNFHQQLEMDYRFIKVINNEINEKEAKTLFKLFQLTDTKSPAQYLNFSQGIAHFMPHLWRLSLVELNINNEYYLTPTFWEMKEICYDKTQWFLMQWENIAKWELHRKPTP